MQPQPMRAAEYIRMSTGSQDLSPETQKEVIAAYARNSGITVIQTYLDPGRSGLTLQKRPAMKRLLRDVCDENCPYSIVLVYDVSRWGRFQDPDAAAYHEYHCRLNGVDVRYVQEPFIGLESLMGSLFKSMKRVMAAEASRENSVKTTAGQSLTLASGFQLGTLPCVGLSRVAVAKSDGAERPLGPTDHKSGRGEHIRWVPGPAHEVQIVQRIFRLYATTELSVTSIAALLRKENVKGSKGRPITEWMLYRFLRCEAFVGDFVWGREENRKRRDVNDVRVRRHLGFMPPIVSREIFDLVQAKLARREHVLLTRELLLAPLKKALEKNPRLTGTQLKAYGCPCRESYIKAFGSLEHAWKAVGATKHVLDKTDFAENVAASKIGSMLCQTVANALRIAGVQCANHGRPSRNNQTLLLNGHTVLRTQPVWKRPRYQGTEWSLRKVYKGYFDWALIVRLNADHSPFDSLLVSRKQYFELDVWLHDDLPETWLRHQNLEQIAQLFTSLTPGLRTLSGSGQATSHAIRGFAPPTW